MNGRIPGQFGMERNPDLIPIPHASGFAIDAVEEARPSQKMLDLPGMRDELRRPMMLLVKAVAQKE